MTSAIFSTSTEAQQAAALLDSYRFELGGHDARQWVSLWLEFYKPNWVRDAVIESLYQGRYKSVSVRQILELWQRRGQPIRHVTHEFEAAVCREFGEVKVPPTPATLPVQHRSIRIRDYANTEGANAKNFSSEDLSSGNLASGGLASGNLANGLAAPTARSRRPVSFDLSNLAPLPPGMAAMVPSSGVYSEDALNSAVSGDSHNDIASRSGGPSRKEISDNTAWRDFPSYTTPLYEQITTTSDPQEVLQAQRQFNGVLYSSARAIQPFKPALPFSPKTLRRAKQKAMDIMAEAH